MAICVYVYVDGLQFVDRFPQLFNWLMYIYQNKNHGHANPFLSVYVSFGQSPRVSVRIQNDKRKQINLWLLLFAHYYVCILVCRQEFRHIQID